MSKMSLREVKVTTQDIADRLNLSRNTVSKALNNSPEVNEKTRKKVLETALQMGYKKVKQDTLLAAAQPESLDIGILIDRREMVNNFWNRILKGVDEYLTRKNSRIIFGVSTGGDEEKGQIPPSFQNGRLHGVISVGAHRPAVYETLKKAGIPVVSVDNVACKRESDLPCDTILTSNMDEVYEITQRMIGAGYRKITFVGNPGHSRNVYERWLGFRAAVRDCGLPENVSPQEFLSVDLRYEIWQIKEHLLQVRDFPDAYVCANDNLAHKLCRLLGDKGLRPGKDFVISGFDNFDTENHEVLFTSVGYNIKELGLLAARQLLFRLANPELSQVIIRPASRLIFRDWA